MAPTPEQEQIIQEEKLAVLATLRSDGSPQLSPINYAYQDGRFLISTTRDRAKYKNVRRNPQVSLCIVQAGGHPYVMISGNARIEEADIEEGTAQIVRNMSDQPPPENFAERLREQGRILIIVTPERFVP